MEIKIDNLIKIVFEYYNLDSKLATDIKYNKREVVQAKYICYKLIKLYNPKMSNGNIAKIFRGQAHDNFNYGIKQIDGLIEFDKRVKNDYELLLSKIDYLYLDDNLKNYRLIKQRARQKKSLMFRSGLNR